MLPTDFSDLSKNSLTYAIDLARKFDSDLFIFHAFDEDILDPYYFGHGEQSDNYYDRFRENFDKLIEDFITDIDTEGVNIVPILSNGVPFIQILRFAKNEDIDMIVISTHGRTGLAQMLLGSTAEKIIRKAHCPVLTIRHPEFEFEMP
jgi:nucleotide-binding universal stress UspA family protein